VVATIQNYWPEAKTAKAFWGQQELPAYKQLLDDTIDWCAPKAGEVWLDLGCGGGALSKALWERSGGQVASILGMDVAAVNETAYENHRKTLTPPPSDRLRFQTHDFSSGLGQLTDASFDAVVSGLSISYAESFDEVSGTWTTAAYDRLLAEVNRVLRPDGRFVFSVNVPEPAWGKVAWHSLSAFSLARKRPLRFLKKSWRMLRYGKWLKVEARKGRFHYLPADAVMAKLVAAGFVDIEWRLSYADQAFVFRARKSGSV